MLNKRTGWLGLAILALLAAGPVNGESKKYQKISSSFDSFSSPGEIVDIEVDTSKGYVYLLVVKDPRPDFIYLWTHRDKGDSLIERFSGYGDNHQTFDKGNVTMVEDIAEKSIHCARMAVGAGSNVYMLDVFIADGPQKDTHLQGMTARKYDQNLDYKAVWGYPAGNDFFYESIDTVLDFRSQAGSLATDKNGNVYVGILGKGIIYKFSADGTFIRSWGRKGTGDGAFDYLTSIAVDKKTGVLYAIDHTERVQKFGLDGSFIDKWEMKPGHATLTDITIDPEHHEVFIADGAKVYRYTGKGESIAVIGPPAGAERLAYNETLGKGILYIAGKHKLVLRERVE